MRSVISVHLYKKTSISVPTDAKHFCPTKKLGFIQKFLWWMLNKTKALKEHHDYEERIERIDIDTDSLVKKVFAMHKNLLSNGLKPKRILMGPEDFDEFLITGREYGIHFPIDFKVEYYLSEYREYPRMYSLPVTIIPHMKGVLIL